MGRIALCRATLLATVILRWMVPFARVDATVAVTATFVDGLLPGTVFLGRRTRKLTPVQKLVLTFRILVWSWMQAMLVLVDLPTILLSRFASSRWFPFPMVMVLALRILLLIRA